MAFQRSIQPRFSETNAVGHIGFTVLPAWCEAALEDVYCLFTPNLDVRDWPLIVVSFQLQCEAEMDHVAEVRVTTSVARIGRSSIKVRQILCQHDRVAARATTTLVCFDYARGRSRPISAGERRSLEAHLETG